MSGIEKIGFYLGILLIVGLLGMIVFSTDGVTDYRILSQKERQVNARVKFETEQNRKIEKEIKSLKHDINYIKHLAKHEHEMAEPDELIFKEKTARKESLP